MRKGIFGLCDLVAQHQASELMGKNLFVFCGKGRRRIKVLYFDASGFALWQKVLQEERFFWPKKNGDNIVTLTPKKLEWLLEGIDIKKMKPFAALSYQAFN